MTVTWFDWAGAALAAFMVAWLVAVVPGAVPDGNRTVIDTWAVVPAGSGVNNVNSAVPVAGLYSTLAKFPPNCTSAAARDTCGGSVSVMVAFSHGTVSDEHE